MPAAEAALPASLNSSWSATGATAVVALAASLFGLHMLVAGRYGFFRDELYYAACGQHLAWGYVDHAPLIAFIAWAVRKVLGDSLYALRLLPAFSGAAKILLTAWMVRELGGSRFAQVLTAVLLFFCPIYLTMDSFFNMNSFEPLFWMGAAAVVMRTAGAPEGRADRLWLLLGLIAGVGVLNKHSMLFFGFALLLGLLVSSGFKYFRSPWIWLGGLIVFAFFLPNLLWQVHNNYPTLEILRNAPLDKNAVVPWYDFIAQQALLVQPLAAPIVLAGLWFFLRDKNGRRYRFLGWTYVFLLLIMLALHARIYYLAPAYPMLFAAGAVWTEQRIAGRHWAWAKPTVLAPLVVAGLIVVPLAIPLSVPVDAAAAYSDFWHVNDVHVESNATGRLPQFFADQFGWPEQAALVASVYRTLPADDRAHIAILAGNYGEASAIDYFGPSYGLPRAISPHNAYYLWGTQGETGEVAIAVGMDLDVLNSLYSSVQQVAVIRNDNAMPSENNVPVYVCRGLREPLAEAWPRLKSYI